MSNYPDGMPGPQDIEIRILCTNEKCEHTWKAPAVRDLGMTDLVEPEDIYCPNCGTEGE